MCTRAPMDGGARMENVSADCVISIRMAVLGTGIRAVSQNEHRSKDGRTPNRLGTHTHTHTHTHKHTHTQGHSQTDTHKHTHTHSHTQGHNQTDTHTRRDTVKPRPPPHTHTPRHTLSHADTRGHTTHITVVASSHHLQPVRRC